MKKILLSILMLLMVIPFSACNKSNEKPIIDGRYGIEDTILLTRDEFKNKLTHKDDSGEKIIGDDFILYVYTEGCTACANFDRNVLKPFIKEYDAIVYKIEYEDYKGLISTPSKYGMNPKIVLINDGKLYTQVTPNQDVEVFSKMDSLANYIKENTILSKLHDITYDQFKTKIENKESFIVYYGWDRCGDCSYLKNNHLNEMIVENKKDTVWYYLEVSEYRQYKTSEGNGENEHIWNEFIETTGININNNRGVVPTICYYENGVFKDYVIYFNDILEIDGATSKLKIVETNNKNADDLIGLEFDSYFDYQKGVEEKHNSLLDNFMNKYYK